MASNPHDQSKTKEMNISWWRRHRIDALRLSVLVLAPLLFLARPLIEVGSVGHVVLDSVGIILIFVGVMGRFWCIIHIGGRKSKSVYQDGPYSICRHPLYLFSTVATFGVGLTFGSVLIGVVLGLLVFGILYKTARHEERYLLAQFNQDYRDYARRVPRMIPRFSLWKDEPKIFLDTKALYGNFRDALVFMSFIPLSRLCIWLREEYQTGFILVF